MPTYPPATNQPAAQDMWWCVRGEEQNGPEVRHGPGNGQHPTAAPMPPTAAKPVPVHDSSTTCTCLCTARIVHMHSRWNGHHHSSRSWAAACFSSAFCPKNQHNEEPSTVVVVGFCSATATGSTAQNCGAASSKYSYHDARTHTQQTHSHRALSAARQAHR